MHMADALLSPTVGGVFLAVSGATLAYSARRVQRDPEERRVPLMGVLGAFVFAAQMINFSIPGTGSSGHIVGGVLLAILLGPYAAFLVVSSVLVVQCLFFLDGGILALGTNMFNMGVWPCFLGLLIYRTIAGKQAGGRWRLWLAATVAVVVSLELGALGVVIQTLLSGRSDLPLGRFAGLMLGIHLPIALVEGLVTAAVVEFIRAIRPGVVAAAAESRSAATARNRTIVPLLASLAALAILTASFVAWFASPRPDGLEWALERVQGAESGRAAETAAPAPALAHLQEKTALMPDYDFPADSDAENGGGDGKLPWPRVDAGTSVAGLVGGAITFAIVCLIGLLLFWLRPRAKKAPE